MTGTSDLQEFPAIAFDVFISYSSRNKLIADAMKQYLQSKGIRCWKAPDDIVHGESWAAAIPRAIKSSQIMILIWTIDSMSSRQVVNELTLADRAQKLIIPFRTEPIEPENEFEYYLAKTHWLDAFASSKDDYFELLSQRVLRNLDQSARPSVKKTSPEIFMRRLQGDELLQKIRELRLRDTPKAEIVRVCGYVIIRKDGTGRLNFKAFYDALVEARLPELLSIHEDAKAQIEMGEFVYAIEKLDQAIARAASMNRLEPEIYYDRALALSKLSRFHEALDDLKLAIKMSEQPKTLHYRLRGLIHKELGDLASAKDDWKLAAELGDAQCSAWLSAQHWSSRD
jgi:tetratricopeptide (TPR) repeat protein